MRNPYVGIVLYLLSLSYGIPRSVEREGNLFAFQSQSQLSGLSLDLHEDSLAQEEPVLSSFDAKMGLKVEDSSGLVCK
jgi:hypothetical protein